MCLASEIAFQREFRGVSELMNKSCNNRVDAENDRRHDRRSKERGTLLYQGSNNVQTNPA